jgi:hypothetical protein
MIDDVIYQEVEEFTQRFGKVTSHNSNFILNLALKIGIDCIKTGKVNLGRIFAGAEPKDCFSDDQNLPDYLNDGKEAYEGGAISSPTRRQDEGSSVSNVAEVKESPSPHTPSSATVIPPRKKSNNYDPGEYAEILKALS